MHRDAPSCPKVAVGPHGLLGIHVGSAHEPARLIGSDGEERHIRRAAAAADIREEKRVITRVTRKVERPSTGSQNVAAPETDIGLEEAPAAPKERGHQLNRSIARPLEGLPPVEF